MGDQYYAAQPGPTPQMNAGGNRNALNKPTNNKGEREWSFGLMDCLDDTSTCCIAWCLPGMIYQRNKSRREHLEKHGTPHPQGGSMVGFDCFFHTVLASCGGCCIFIQMGERGNIRTRYRIDGGGCGDCMAATCCNPCDLTQSSREIELEEQSFGGKH